MMGSEKEFELPEDASTEIVDPSIQPLEENAAEFETQLKRQIALETDNIEIQELAPQEDEFEQEQRPEHNDITSDTNLSTDTNDAAWKRLHPMSLLINLLPQMWRTIQTTWPILLFLFFGGQGSETQLIDASFVLIFLLISMFRTLFHFLTLRYRMQNGKLVVKMGLFVRQARTLDPARIQNLELTQNPLHKITGLVELRVETAGEASNKGLFSALTVSEASALKEQLQQSIGKTKEKKVDQEDIAPILTQSIPEILLYGLSRRTVGTVVVLTAISSEIMAMMDPNQAQKIAVRITPQVFFGLLFISFAGSWLWSSAQALLRHYRTQLFIEDDGVQIGYGLLTRRKVEIPHHKIQSIEVFEPWLRRQMGFSSMYIETAALGMADGEIRKSEGLIPMIAREKTEDILNSIAPKIAKGLWAADLHSADPRALYRITAKNLFSASAISIIGISLFQPYGWITLLGFPLAVVIARLDWSKQGWMITENTIISRRGYLNRKTWLLDRSKIQSVFIYQDPFLRIQNLGLVLIKGAGSTVTLPLIQMETAHQIVGDLRNYLPPIEHSDDETSRGSES